MQAKTDRLEELIIEYALTCSSAEHLKLRGESMIMKGMELLKQADEEYHKNDEIRKKISEIM